MMLVTQMKGEDYVDTRTLDIFKVKYLNELSIFYFYRTHFELIEQYHVSQKKLLQQGISNPEFY